MGTMDHVLFTGGGSAGHVVPCLPLIRHFQAAGARVSFVGTAAGPERAILAPTGIEFHAVRAGKLRRYWSWRNVADLWWIAVGIVQALRVLHQLRPSVVFSKGGFVAFPVVVAAWLSRVPVVAHESDLTPGLANRLSLPFVAAVCTTFQGTRFAGHRCPVIHTGTPLRAELLTGDAARGRARLDAPVGRPIVVVVGGSLGAQALNAVVRAGLPQLLEFGLVVHVCGPGRTDPSLSATPGYRQFEYVVDGWGDMLAAADVVISRAGANSLYELVALRKPHLLVPLSREASRGDQLANAQYAQSRGWSLVIEEQELDAARLNQAVVEIYAARAQLIDTLAGAGLGDGTAPAAAVIRRFAQRRS
jgi:UDP-N-acetylglucosamine--N-acetylmuramyl-(pentapeptide) pyrophosphoryl-undecaprenol N-acetylglucosamine transferase